MAHQVKQKNKQAKGRTVFTNKNGPASFFAPAIIQPKLRVNAPNDIYEKEADAVADKVMRMPGPQPLAESSTPVIQRKLTAESTYPPYLVNSVPGRNPASDPASRLSPAQRIAHVGGLLQNLCPDFQTDSTSGIVSPVDASRTADQVAAGNKPVGCCCQHVLTRPASNNWRILVSDIVGPHTLESEHVVVIPGPNAPIDYGNWTKGPAERRVILSNEGVLGHELCGHAALLELRAHPPDRSRLTTDVHDPTVNIQNLIATEQGVPASDLRGLASEGPHRGESFARIVISGYPANRISPFSIPDRTQQQKLFLATNLIRTNDFFVNIVGHTDPSGTDAINDRISLQRANTVKGFIAGRVPPNRHLDRQDTTTPLAGRFRSTIGVRDSQPPPAAVQANPDSWRRVEIFMASFPAATENAPAATPATVTPLPPPAQASALAVSGDECEKELVKGAYPGISANPAAPAISPKREMRIQRKCTHCEEEDRKVQLKESPALIQRQEAEGESSPDFTLPSPWQFRPSADPDFLSMRQPFIDRSIFDLWDPDAALEVWQYNFDFFRRFGLSPGISTTLTNLTAPRFIDAQLKLNNPTWWEITDLELNTSTIGASIPLLEFNPDFSPVAPSWFRNIFQGGGSTIQRKSASCESGNVFDPGIEQSIHARKGQGRALSGNTRDFMEPRIGADFSQVKIHADASAAQLSRKLNAQAFTHGSDIYFNEGKYAPGTGEGKRLLAHELTHVVQQGAAFQTPQIQRTNTSLTQQELGMVNVFTNPRLQFLPAEITRTAYGNVAALAGSGGLRGDAVSRLNVIIGEGTTIAELASYLLPLWSLATPDAANPGISSTPPTLDELSRALLMYNYGYYGGNTMSFWQAGLRVPLPVLLDNTLQSTIVNTSFIQALASGYDAAHAALLNTPATPSVAMPVIAGDPNQAQTSVYWEQQASAFSRANTDASSRGVHLFSHLMRNARETERLYHALFRVLSPDELFEMTISLLDLATNRDFQLLAYQEYGRTIIFYIESAILNAPSAPSPGLQGKIDRAMVMLGLANNIPAAVTGEMPLPETACENGVRQVMIDFVQLFGSQRNIRVDLLNANRLFEKCCVRFMANSIHQADEITSKQWIGDDLAVNAGGGSCASPAVDERRMRREANNLFSLSAPYKAFYVKDIVGRNAGGYAFTQECGATTFLNHLVAANDGSSTVLAHELGHLLTNRNHVRDFNNLMHESSPGEQLTSRQCRRIFTRADRI